MCDSSHSVLQVYQTISWEELESARTAINVLGYWHGESESDSENALHLTHHEKHCHCSKWNTCKLEAVSNPKPFSYLGCLQLYKRS